MKKLSAKSIKFYFQEMEKYYSEVEMQILVNTVNYIEESNLEYDLYKTIIENMSLRDRHTCISLAVIYNKIKAYHVIDTATVELTKKLFDEYKSNIINKSLDDYFKNYKPLDYFCLKRSIEDDGLYIESYLTEHEQELMINIIDFKQGKKDKVLTKKNTTQD